MCCSLRRRSNQVQAAMESGRAVAIGRLKLALRDWDGLAALLRLWRLLPLPQTVAAEVLGDVGDGDRQSRSPVGTKRLGSKHVAALPDAVSSDAINTFAEWRVPFAVLFHPPSGSRCQSEARPFSLLPSAITELHILRSSLVAHVCQLVLSRGTSSLPQLAATSTSPAASVISPSSTTNMALEVGPLPSDEEISGIDLPQLIAAVSAVRRVLSYLQRQDSYTTTGEGEGSRSQIEPLTASTQVITSSSCDSCPACIRAARPPHHGSCSSCQHSRDCDWLTDPKPALTASCPTAPLALALAARTTLARLLLSRQATQQAAAGAAGQRSLRGYGRAVAQVRRYWARLRALEEEGVEQEGGGSSCKLAPPLLHMQCGWWAVGHALSTLYSPPAGSSCDISNNSSGIVGSRDGVTEKQTGHFESLVQLTGLPVPPIGAVAAACTGDRSGQRRCSAKQSSCGIGSNVGGSSNGSSCSKFSATDCQNTTLHLDKDTKGVISKQLPLGQQGILADALPTPARVEANKVLLQYVSHFLRCCVCEAFLQGAAQLQPRHRALGDSASALAETLDTGVCRLQGALWQGSCKHAAIALFLAVPIMFSRFFLFAWLL